MNLQNIIEKIDIWEDWRSSYTNWVPKFIHEATTKFNWEEWDQEVFYEYFERSNQQCVSSLKQGYFTNADKQRIKDNWKTIGPLLKKIAESQDLPLFETYIEIKQEIRKLTGKNLKAATNRLIAGVQPQLLCTVVHETRVIQLIHLLNDQLEDADLSVHDNWFKNSNEVLNYFRKQIPNTTVFEIATLPWQAFEYLSDGNNNNDDIMYNEVIEEALSLLKYKKQIILQGPPGTGKTRMAKELANELMAEISDADIHNYIQPGVRIKSAYDKLDYEIDKIVGSTINIINSVKGPSSTTFEKVKQAFSGRLWRGDKIKSESDSYSAAVAKYLFETLPGEQVKLIQFHPGYTYEDFVRGIIAESNGDTVEYKNVNRILGMFAELSTANWLASQKDVESAALERNFDKYFDGFILAVDEELASNGKIPLTSSVDIVDIDIDAFRYKGKNGWSAIGNRMLFKDIKKAYLDGNSTRKDIVNNKTLSGLAIQHATYYAKVLDKLNEFMKTNQYQFDAGSKERVPLKNYVIIIDEINRANLPAVLGELIYALEYRGEPVESMYEVDGNKKLILPPNLFIIGTMNTADRGVGHIDYAIRRRFAFVQVLPEDLSPTLGERFKLDLFNKVEKLFYHNTNLSREFDRNDVQLGHSYFIHQYEKDANGDEIKDKPHRFSYRLQCEIIPILLEYVKDGILVGKVGDKTITDYIQSLENAT